MKKSRMILAITVSYSSQAMASDFAVLGVALESKSLKTLLK